MILTALLFGFGGLLVGGTLSLRSQGVRTGVQVVVAVLAPHDGGARVVTCPMHRCIRYSPAS